jgi:outer membrane lipoprotein SlyB
MRLLHIAVAFVAVTLAFGDTIIMRDGRVLHGNYLGGTPRQVKIESGDQIQTLDVADIARIEFGGSAPMVSGQAPPREERREVLGDERHDDRRMMGITLQAGTNLVVRTIDAVDSQTASVGQNFAGSLDEPVVDADGRMLIPRGADVTLKLVDAKQSGKISGRTELALSLMSVRVNGQMVDIQTQTITEKSTNRAGRSAGTIGGGAIGGAILGSIIGGGKGAAIGAGAGAAGGAAVELATSGQRVRVPSETRLTFVLDNPVRF